MNSGFRIESAATLPLVDIAMLGTFTLFDWPNLTTFLLFTEGEMLTKISFLFLYFCCHVETEGVKAKLLPKSGRIFRLRQTFGTASGT